MVHLLLAIVQMFIIRQNEAPLYRAVHDLKEIGYSIEDPTGFRRPLTSDCFVVLGHLDTTRVANNHSYTVFSADYRRPNRPANATITQITIKTVGEAVRFESNLRRVNTEYACGYKNPHKWWRHGSSFYLVMVDDYTMASQLETISTRLKKSLKH